MKKYIQHPIIQLMTGSTLSQVITLAFMPVISRLYDPSHVGIAGVFTTFASICFSLINFQYDQALYSTKDAHDIPKLKALNARIIFFSTILCSVVFLVLKYFQFLAFEVLEYKYVFILIVLLLLVGFSRIGRILAVKESQFKKISKVTLSSSLVGNFTKTILGFVNSSAVSFLFAEAITQFAIFIGYFRNLFFFREKKKITLQELKSIALKYKEYPTYGQLSIFLDTLSLALPLQFITDIYGATSAGIYIFASRIANIINVNLGLAISDVFISRFSDYYRSGQYSELKKLFKTTIRRSLLISIPTTILLMTIPPLLFGFIFGQRWESGGKYFSIIVPWIMAAFIVSPVSSALVILKKQKIKLIYDVIILILLCFVFFLGQYFNLTISNFLICISCAQVFSYLIYYYIIAREVNNL